MSLEDVTGAMSELGILDTYISRLHRDLDTVIINPLFTVDSKEMAPKAIYDGSKVQLSKKSEISNPSTFVREVDGLVRFVTSELPERLYQPLLESLLPSLMVQLITNSLDPSVPVDLNQMNIFKDSLMKIEDLADYIDTLDVPIPSDGDLSSWVERLPQTWLAKRREAALAQMRSISYAGAKSQKTVERVETQIVSSDDVMVANGQGQEEDEWNADWAEEEEADESEHADVPTSADDDEDASAWGLEDEPEAEKEETKPAASDPDGEDEEEVGHAKGLGERDPVVHPVRPVQLRIHVVGGVQGDHGDDANSLCKVDPGVTIF